MINVQDVLRAVPHFGRFCSVDELQRLAERLRTDARFIVTVRGTSQDGSPVHHVRFGSGRVKALVLGFPHPNEPVGGLTVFSLLTLLERGHPQLVNADVEWHVIPCIDPDGARLNEGWSQAPFSLRNYMKHFHRQEIRDQVESSFPIRYKKLVFDSPTAAASILQSILTDVRPDLYFTLHDMATSGGAWYSLTRDIPRKYHLKLYGLLERHGVPLRRSPPFEGFVEKFGDGIIAGFSTKKWYDFLEQTAPEPQELLSFGNTAHEYLAEINGAAMTFVAEVPFVRHPSDGSTQLRPQSLRRLKLRVYADVMYVTTVILEEWNNVEPDLDPQSPFYRKIVSSVIRVKGQLTEGLPGWPEKMRDLLFSPVNGRAMTEGDRFSVHLKQFFIFCQYYEFVRLLRASVQTHAVQRAIERLEAVFDELVDEIGRNIDFEKFEAIDCDALVKVQLGSGLVVLNSILESRGGRA